MVLSDIDIKKHMKEGQITISPMDEKDIQPCSIDLHLGKSFCTISPDAQPMTSTSYTLEPGAFVLATTQEYVSLSDCVLGRLEGKSSIARLGLIIHTTAGFIDPGFEGEITLEIVNLSGSAYELEAGQPIAQICFEELSSPCERPYGSRGLVSHYQGQTGATESWMSK